MTIASDWQALRTRVARVFAALRKDGINARGPVGFTKSDAIHTVAVKPERYHGFAYFHSQDSQTARAGGDLWIGFGCTSRAATPVEVRAVGRAVATGLKAEGLFVKWNGKATERVAVHLSPAAARAAGKRDVLEAKERARALRKLEADRRAPDEFFPALRKAMRQLAQEGAYRVMFRKDMSYEARNREAVLSKKTVVVCPSEFSSSWDKVNVDIRTYPVAHDKSVVKEIAQTLRVAGFTVSYVHASYLHIRVTK